MASPIPTQAQSAIVTLTSEHRAALTALLERDIPLNLFALSWLDNCGPVAARPGLFHFRGIFGPEGQLEAMALVITDKLVMLDARREVFARSLGTWYCEAAFHFTHIVSAAAHARPFWDAYALASHHIGSQPMRARLISPQRTYLLTRARWMHQLEHAHAHVGSTGLREARVQELDAVFLASVHMHREETLEDPLQTQPEVFRHHVGQRIRSRRCFVWFDDSMRLIFKADISAQSRYGVQVSGVYTAPHMRGQGIATRAMVDLCRAMFTRGWPRITLYVNTQNAPARKLYERVGFRYHDDYVTIFVQP